MKEEIKEDLLNYIRENDDRVKSIVYYRHRQFNEDDEENPHVVTDKYHDIGLIGEHYIVKCIVELVDLYSPQLELIDIQKTCIVNKKLFYNWREKQYAITWL